MCLTNTNPRNRRNTLPHSKHLWLLAPITIVIVLTLGVSTTLAGYDADGDLDTSFGGDGKVISNFGGDDYGLAGILQPDGRALEAGSVAVGSGTDFGVARFNPNGSPDSNFSGDGKQTTDFGGNDAAYALALQADGKIVVGGYVDAGSNTDYALARYLVDGTLDTTFDTDGRVTTHFGAEGAAIHDLAVQSDGKIVAVGLASFNGDHDFALARYNPDGSLDTSFSGNGKQTTDFGGIDDSGYAVVLQPDGKIVVSGYAGPPNDHDFALAKYLPNGDLDTSFSFDGKQTTNFGNDDVGYALALQPDGKLILGGIAMTGATYNFALARYLPNGDPDTSFSGNGRVTTDFNGGVDGVTGVAIQSDGKIVAGGVSDGDGSADFALVRYLADGTLDTTFNSDGKLTTDFTGGEDVVWSVMVQPNGRILAAGYAYTNNHNRDFALTRYLGDAVGSPTPTAASPTRTPGGPSATPHSTPTSCPIQFTDVLPGSTFYDYVRCMACRSIITGYTTGCDAGNPCFKPNSNITRGQLSKIVANAAGFNESAGAQQYEDVPEGSTFFDFVWRLADRGYVSGYTCGGPGEPCGGGNLPYFRPNGNASRGQISKIVSNSAGFTDPTGAQMFEDVPPGSTFYDFIQRLATRAILGGYACGGPGEPCGGGNLPYLRPNAKATRGQTSKIIANAFFPNCQTPAQK